MRDTPRGPDQPDEPDDNGDQSNESDHSDRADSGDRPHEHDRDEERDPHSGARYTHWSHVDDLELRPDDEETQRAAEEKLQLRHEGFDDETLDALYGSDEELGLVDASEPSNQSDQPDDPDETTSGWDDPTISDNPERPNLDEVHLPDKRREHIAMNHVSGVGKLEKTEYPPEWNEDTIKDTVIDVARNPDQVPEQRDKSRLWVVEGTRDGVTVRTVVRSDGAIMTGYPLPGGPGVVQNPPKDKS